MHYKHFNSPRGVIALVSLGLAAFAPAAWAAPAVTSQLQVSQIVHAASGDVLSPAAQAKPGDLLQYRAIYTNSGTTAAGHLRADLPIPPGTTLLAAGMDPSGAQATLDGKTYAAMPLLHTVVGKDGQAHQEPVPLSQIRALRWDLGTLAPRETRAVQLRVHVDTPVVATPVAPSASFGS